MSIPTLPGVVFSSVVSVKHFIRAGTVEDFRLKFVTFSGERKQLSLISLSGTWRRPVAEERESSRIRTH